MKPTLSALLLFLLAPLTLLACAAVGRDGMQMRIAEENAIILWDARTKMEHFIRRASFQTNGYDFGFIVPTPSKPELVEVKGPAFAPLEQLLVPEVIYRRPFFGMSRERFAAMKASDAAPSGGVRVLEEKQLGRYHAVILEADNAEKLNEWLGKHGYSSRPALVKWFEPYIAKKWKITAFKVAPDATVKQHAQLDAIRMSFKTEVPFYPYREPEDAQAIARLQNHQGGDSRSLRVYFLGTERMEGHIGDRESKDWHAPVKWAGTLPDRARNSVLAHLGLGEDRVPESLWLTTFEDRSSPRPATDEVYFKASSNQAEVKSAPIVRYLDPVVTLEDILIVLVSGLVVVLLFVGLRRLLARSSP